MLTDIVLDAVGSDKAPEPEIRGAILACQSLPVRVHLVALALDVGCNFFRRPLADSQGRRAGNRQHPPATVAVDLQQDTTLKESLRGKRLMAGWNEQVLARILLGFGR